MRTVWRRFVRRPFAASHHTHALSVNRHQIGSILVTVRRRHSEEGKDNSPSEEHGLPFAVSLHDTFFLSFISLIADGPHHYHPACGHKGSSHLSPVHALQFFYRDASSALLQLVNHWLNFTYSHSHAFRHERKNTNPTLVRIELTTSVLADVQLTY